jgi:nucleoside permease NupC
VMINIIATTGRNRPRNRPLAVSKASSRFFISFISPLIPCEDIHFKGLLGVALGPFDYKAVPIPHLTYAARANASSLAFIEFVAFNGSSYTDSP